MNNTEIQIPSFSQIVVAACFTLWSPQIVCGQTRASAVYIHPVALSSRPLHSDPTRSTDSRAAERPRGDIPHGVIGAVSGAIIGGGLGYLYMAAHCDNGVCEFPARAVFTGAVAGAVLGMIVEYGVRSWPRG